MKVDAAIIRLIFWWFVVFLIALAIPAGAQVYFKLASEDSQLSLKTVATLMRISAALVVLSGIPLIAGLWRTWKLNRRQG